MWMIKWVKDTASDFLSWFGLLPENAKLLFLGLDNAGKTTLLYVLRDDRITTHIPTLHPHSEELYMGNRRFKAFDLGGHESARRIWRDYYADVDGIVFLVDAADRTRMQESKNELQALFETESLKHVPFAVVGNKIDIPTACSEEELRTLLDIQTNYNFGYGQQAQSTSSGQVMCRPGGGATEVFMVSLKQKSGYSAAFKWISEVLKQQTR